MLYCTFRLISTWSIMEIWHLDFQSKGHRARAVLANWMLVLIAWIAFRVSLCVRVFLMHYIHIRCVLLIEEPLCCVVRFLCCEKTLLDFKSKRHHARVCARAVVANWTFGVNCVNCVKGLAVCSSVFDAVYSHKCVLLISFGDNDVWCYTVRLISTLSFMEIWHARCLAPRPVGQLRLSICILICICLSVCPRCLIFPAMVYDRDPCDVE